MSTTTAEPPNGVAAISATQARPHEPALAGSRITTVTEAPHRPDRRRRLIGLTVLAVALIGGTAAGVYLYVQSLRYTTTDDAFVDGHIERVAPQVTGRVMRVLVRDNEVVQAGQVIAELDPAEYVAQVDQAKGDVASAESAVRQAAAQKEAARATLASAQADLQVAEAGLDQSRAEVNLAAATASNAATQRDRYVDIQKSSPNAVAEQQIDDARTTAQTTAAKLASAQSSVALAQAKVTLANAGIAQAQAALSQADAVMGTAAAQQLVAKAKLERAQIDLDRTKVVAHTAGRVTRRTVDPGNIVQPGQALLAIVSEDVWVTANLKETQLAKVRKGQAVDVSIDALPGHVFRAKVDSIMAGTGSAFSLLPAENATGNFVKVVQRVPVKIVFDQSDELTKRLSIGMSVEPMIHINGERPAPQAAGAD